MATETDKMVMDESEMNTLTAPTASASENQLMDRNESQRLIENMLVKIEVFFNFSQH